MRVFVTVASVTLLVALLLSPVAHASHVSCGAVLTTDTTLDSDLTCTGDGLVIGASGTRVDLGGHTLRGDGGDTGIRNIKWAGGEISNGTIANFDNGVFFNEVHGNRVHDLTFSGGGFGFAANTSAFNRIDHNRFLDNGSPAISIRFDSVQNSVDHNTASAFGAPYPPIWGILVNGSYNNTLTDNSVAGYSTGIGLLGGGLENVVERNVVEQNAEGITLGLRERNSRVSRNLVRGNDVGIRVEESFGNTFEANEVHANDQIGIAVDLTWYSAGYSSTDNTLAGNRVSGSETGIELFHSNDNSLDGNSAYANSGDGIHVDAPSAGTAIRRNLAYGNGDDGIDTDISGTSFASNYVFRNGDWGIEAVQYVSDAGGNRGWSNGQAAQCLNVVCGAGPPARCKINGTAHLLTAGGDPARAKLNVRTGKDASSRGTIVYQAQGDERLRLRSVSLEVVACERGDATIVGTALVNGRGHLDFRLAVHDGGPRRSTFQIVLDDGYDSGSVSLTSGRLRVR